MTSTPNTTQDQQKFNQELTYIAKNSGIGGSGILIGNIINYATNILITRTVGAEYYGLFYLGTNIVGLMNLVWSFGFYSGVLKFVSLYAGQNDYSRVKGVLSFALKYILAASCFALVVIYLGANYTSYGIFDKPKLEIALKILAFAMPFTMITALYLSTLQGLRLIKYNVLVTNVFSPLSKLVLLGVFFISGIYYIGLMLAFTIASLLTCLLAVYFLTRSLRVHQYKPIFDNKNDFFKFSRPIYFQQFFNFAVTSLPVYFLSYFHSSGDTGIYGIGLSLSIMVSLSLRASNMIFAPTISMLYGKGEKATLEQLFKVITKWIFTLAFFVFLVIILFATPILQIFGEDFIRGKTAIYLIVLGELVNAGVGAVGFMLMMTGRPQINLLNSVVLFFVTLTGCYFLIPTYGLVGAGLTVAISTTLLNLLSLLQVYYYERIHPYNIKFLKPLAAGILAFIIVSVMKSYLPVLDIISSGVLLIIFVILFAINIWVLKLDENDKLIFDNIMKKLKLKSI